MAFNKRPELPLCIDMDGTLIKTDLMFESLILLLRHDFLSLVSLAFTLLTKGIPTFKTSLFTKANLKLENLPYHYELINYIKGERATGRTVVLATASSQSIADRVAKHLGIFDLVLGSDSLTNLSGNAKAKLLCEKFGNQGFVYAGNAPVDFKVWRTSAAAIIVQAPHKLLKKAERAFPIEATFPRDHSARAMIIKALRPHQWAKNGLIFLPLILSHQIHHLEHLMKACLAFVAFCLMSSGTYIINDLLDLDSDRVHPDKRKRPFAAGNLSLETGISLTLILICFGLAVGEMVSRLFLGALLGYSFLTVLYSFKLKEVALVDTLILAALYTWRIFAGSFAVNIPISAWFLTFSSFIFLSLALLKRSSELILLSKNGLAANHRRGYLLSDLELLVSLGTSAGYISVLVLALYINSVQNTGMYRYPIIMWISCPCLLYWISTMWLKAHRGLMTSDPLVFALKDRTLHIVMIIIAFVWIVASGVV